jgi:hypothetical protein
LVWLAPETLPAPATTLTVWEASGSILNVNATLDITACYGEAGPVSCASPPIVVAGDSSTKLPSVLFTSPGRVGLGSNLILPLLNFSSPSTAFTLFFACASAGPSVGGQRLLSGYLNNWVLGTWYDGLAGVTYENRAYTDQPAGDGGWLYSGRVPAEADVWRVYGLVAFGNGSACFYSNVNATSNPATALACGPSEGPNGLRLGGGQAWEFDTIGPAEFGNGRIGELLVWPRALPPTDIQQTFAYLAHRFPAPAAINSVT